MKTNISKKTAIQIFGNSAKLAAALGITKQAVSQWSDDKPIPREKALLIRYELRPDLFKSDAA